MFVRFVVAELDPDSNQRKGIFQAAHELLEQNADLADAERIWARSSMDWFNAQLARPASLATSRRPNAKSRAVSWFRETAREHIAQARSLVSWLETQGVNVDELREKNPGYVIYEDEFQVVVDPFVITRPRRRRSGSR